MKQHATARAARPAAGLFRALHRIPIVMDQPLPAVERVGNCRPPVHSRFKKGQSGNPGGSRSAGAYVREWINVMRKWPKDRLERVLESDKAPAAKKAAARVWLHAITTATTDKGTPIAGPELDRICDRTEGKPKQSIDVNSNSTITVTEGASRAASLIDAIQSRLGIN